MSSNTNTRSISPEKKPNHNNNTSPLKKPSTVSSPQPITDKKTTVTKNLTPNKPLAGRSVSPLKGSTNPPSKVPVKKEETNKRDEVGKKEETKKEEKAKQDEVKEDVEAENNQPIEVNENTNDALPQVLPPNPIVKLPNGAVPAPKPEDEELRLEKVKHYETINFDEKEIAYSSIVQIASVIASAPIAFISLIDENQQHIKSSIGAPRITLDRDTSMCGYTILDSSKLFTVPDTEKDERFNTNPVVLQNNIKYYVGAPLASRDDGTEGSAIGTLCLIDGKAREPLTPDQELGIFNLSRLVVDQLELQKRNILLKKAIEERDKFQEELDAINRRLVKRNQELEEQVKHLQKEHNIFSTPAEKVIQLLQDLRSRTTAHKDIECLDFIVEVVSSHKLYSVDVNSALDSDKSIDNGVKDFLLTQFQSAQPTQPTIQNAEPKKNNNSVPTTNNSTTNNAQNASKPTNSTFKKASSNSNTVKSAPKPFVTKPAIKSAPPRKSESVNNDESNKAPAKNISESAQVPFQPDEYREAFKGHEQWSFDVFEFAKATKGNPLLYTSYYLFEEHNLFTLFPELNKEKFVKFIRAVESGYINTNPYHSNIHATDVVLGTNYFISNSEIIKKYLSPIEILSSLIAAAMHDFGHFGRNNSFLINTDNPLAIRHNDISVLENFHCSESWKLLLDPENYFIENLPLSSRHHIRKTVLNMILATDMASHPVILGQFQNKMNSSSIDLINSMEDKLLVLKMAIKAADISNPARPLPIYQQWVDRVMEEFYLQGDQEKALGMPISSFMDRQQPQMIPKCQTGFISYIVLPTYKQWSSFTGLTDGLACVESNLEFWKQKTEEFEKNEAN